MYIKTEFRVNLIRMWDSIRKNDKGATRCMSVCCDECPLDGTVCNIPETMTVFNAEAAIEIVTQWAKEHPIVTMADKYKEVFGVEPKNERGEYVCPAWAGFDICDKEAICSKGCNEEFWNSEYKEPKKEGE